MSTILKALRRLEEEKAASEEPRPLREQIASAPRGALRSRRTGWLAAALSLVLGVGAGGGVIWWLFGNQTPAPVVASAAPAVAPPTAVAPPEPARVPGLPDQAFASDVELVDRPDALPRMSDSEPMEPDSGDPAPGSVRPVTNSAAAERARQAALAEYNAAERARRGLPPAPVPPAPPISPDPVPVQEAQSAPVEVASAAPAPAPIASAAAPTAPEPVPAPVAPPAPPPVAQAPAAEPAPAPAPAPKVAAAKSAPSKPVARRAPAKEARAPVPAPPAVPTIAVSVEKTQWHPLADRRSAWLRVPGETDAQRVVEGDVIDGLIVSAIEPSGVVFEREGEKIRRPLGQP